MREDLCGGVRLLAAHVTYLASASPAPFSCWLCQLMAVAEMSAVHVWLRGWRGLSTGCQPLLAGLRGVVSNLGWLSAAFWPSVAVLYVPI